MEYVQGIKGRNRASLVNPGEKLASSLPVSQSTLLPENSGQPSEDHIASMGTHGIKSERSRNMYCKLLALTHYYSPNKVRVVGYCRIN